MKETGAALLVFAFIILLVGLGMDVTVTTPSVPGSYVGGIYTPSIPSQEVANVYALHNRSLVVHGAFAVFIAGVLLVGLGFVADRLHGGGGAPAAGLTIPVDAAAPAADSGGSPPSAAPAAPPPPPAPAEVAPITPREWATLAGGIIVVLIIVIAIALSAKRDRAPNENAIGVGANSLSDDEMNRILDEANAALDTVEDGPER
jgi:hypothetical protein